jgi:hypothetical protein
MSTVRKDDKQPMDPYDTVTAEIVRLETATETMMAYIGHLNTEIMKEEDQPKPNKVKIEALEAQKNVVLDERRAITSDNHKLIAKAIYVYAPIMKAFYSLKRDG